MTMEEFGKIFGIGKSAVNNWEKGYNLPSDEKLAKIAELGETTKENLTYIDSQSVVQQSINKLDQQIQRYEKQANQILEDRFNNPTPELYHAAESAFIQMQEDIDNLKKIRQLLLEKYH